MVKLKDALTAVITLFFLTIPTAAQNIPAGIRVEVATAEQNDNEYQIFTYKDEEGVFGYYLGLGKVTRFEDTEILGGSIEDIRETCIWLGATSDEAFATLDKLLDLLDEDVNTTIDFSGRAIGKHGQLSTPITIPCTVQKKTFGGKRLQFRFPCGRRVAECNVYKMAIKELRMEFKIDIKLHKSHHK